MKNYNLLVTKNNNNYIANLFNKDNNNNITTLLLLTYVNNDNVKIIDGDDLSLTMSEWNRMTDNLEEGKILILQSTAQIEWAMRNIGFKKCDSCGCWIAPQDIADSMYCIVAITYVIVSNAPKSSLKTYMLYLVIMATPLSSIYNVTTKT